MLIEAVLGINEESCKTSEMGHYFIVHGILCIINSINVTKVVSSAFITPKCGQLAARRFYWTNLYYREELS